MTFDGDDDNKKMSGPFVFSVGPYVDGISHGFHSISGYGVPSHTHMCTHTHTCIRACTHTHTHTNIHLHSTVHPISYNVVNWSKGLRCLSVPYCNN